MYGPAHVQCAPSAYHATKETLINWYGQMQYSNCKLSRFCRCDNFQERFKLIGRKSVWRVFNVLVSWKRPTAMQYDIVHVYGARASKWLLWRVGGRQKDRVEKMECKRAIYDSSYEDIFEWVKYSRTKNLAAEKWLIPMLYIDGVPNLWQQFRIMAKYNFCILRRCVALLVAQPYTRSPRTSCFIKISTQLVYWWYYKL